MVVFLANDLSLCSFYNPVQKMDCDRQKVDSFSVTSAQVVVWGKKSDRKSMKPLEKVQTTW